MAIVGCGWAGERCARAVAASGGRARVVAAVDVVQAAAQSSAERWAADHVFRDHHSMLRAGVADAAVVCLPHSLHATASVDCLSAGCHVLVEKPLAASLEEADLMIATAAAQRRVLMVAETVRFEPALVQVADIIAGGGIGDVFLVRVERLHQMHQFLREHPWFLEDPAAGIMMSGGIHDFEIVRMLGGEVQHVYALQAPKVLTEMRADDTSTALAQLANGATAVVVESFSARNYTGGLRGSVHGSGGSIWFERGLVRVYGAAQDGEADQVEETRHEPAGFRETLSHFLDCVEHDLEPLTSGRDQRRPLQAVLAAYQSMRSGARVRLEELE